MSTKNKKSVASQALLEMDAITSAIKEESKNTLNTLLAEAVRNALREGCEEEEDKEYDIVDDEQNDAKDKNDDSTSSICKIESVDLSISNTNMIFSSADLTPEASIVYVIMFQ